MKKLLLLITALFTVGMLTAQQTIISNVNLVEVKTGKIIPAQTIIINGDKIEQVGPSAKIKPIPGPQTIDGSGKYIMPGMTDAHIHFFQSGGLYTRPDVVDLRKKMPYEKEKAFNINNATDYLNRYLRLGVTSVIDVGGPMSNFTVRDSISKKNLSPNILVTGPLFSMVERPQFGDDRPIIKIASFDEADALFGKMLPLKPDFIKIWYIAGPTLPAEKNFELVKHIAQLTHTNGLKLAVHATELKTAQLAVEAGADILVHSIDDEVVPDDFAKLLAAKKITYIPTLIVSRGYYNVLTGLLPNHPQDLAWANAFVYGSTTDPEAMPDAEMPPVLKMLRKNGISPNVKTEDSICAINLLKLHKAGVNIASGTDAGNIGTFHASSYIQELEAMQKAGLSIASIIKASTINPAIGFGKEQQWGSIEKGKLADVLLLQKNPLESLQNLNSIGLVFKNGKQLVPDSIIKESPEAIVQRQLNAYNARDIDAFMDTYSEDVELYDFPNKLTGKGKENMRKGYEGFFKNVPNLYCEIEKRIVIGNKVIDHEKVRAGTKTLTAVAVYEVENGKIKKVTFID
jgi:imidazolonepropionase-like amidohydrolase